MPPPDGTARRRSPQQLFDRQLQLPAVPGQRRRRLPAAAPTGHGAKTHHRTEWCNAQYTPVYGCRANQARREETACRRGLQRTCAGACLAFTHKQFRLVARRGPHPRSKPIPCRSRRRDCHFAAPPSTFSRCFNKDGERASEKYQSRRRLPAVPSASRHLLPPPALSLPPHPQRFRSPHTLLRGSTPPAPPAGMQRRLAVGETDLLLHFSTCSRCFNRDKKGCHQNDSVADG